jgi:electron transport complex protein RnfE
VLPDDYPGFLIAILPPGAFFVLGLLIAGRNWLMRAPTSACAKAPAANSRPRRPAAAA